MLVYKYRGSYKRDLSLLSLGKIFVPTFEKLNDPFEGLVESNIEYEFNKLTGSNHNIKESINTLLDRRKSVGIYSLSKSFKDELLWAHYADSHKGFCIEFDIRYLIDLHYLKDDKINFANIINVSYENKSPLVTLNDVRSKNLDLVLRKLIGTKSKSWKYEKECRIIYEQNGALDIDFRSVKAIYFGVRASEEDIAETIASIPFSVDYYKMQMNANYSLERIFIKKSKLRYKYEKPKTKSLWLDESDPEYPKYSQFINDAIKIVKEEPYLDNIIYAGLDRKVCPGSVLIKINANRNMKYTKFPVKFYYFEVKGNRLKRFYN